MPSPASEGSAPCSRPSLESTRLWCAAVKGAQTTLDPQQMKEWTPNSRYGGHAFGLGNFAQYAVQASAHAEKLFVGLEVNVRCTALDGIEQDLVDEPDDRGVINIRFADVAILVVIVTG